MASEEAAVATAGEEPAAAEAVAASAGAPAVEPAGEAAETAGEAAAETAAESAGSTSKWAKFTKTLSGVAEQMKDPVKFMNDMKAKIAAKIPSEEEMKTIWDQVMASGDAAADKAVTLGQQTEAEVNKKMAELLKQAFNIEMDAVLKAMSASLTAAVMAARKKEEEMGFQEFYAEFSKWTTYLQSSVKSGVSSAVSAASAAAGGSKASAMAVDEEPSASGEGEAAPAPVDPEDQPLL